MAASSVPLVAICGPSCIKVKAVKCLAIGGEDGIRTHGTITRTTVFESYDSRTVLRRPVANRVL